MTILVVCIIVSVLVLVLVFRSRPSAHPGIQDGTDPRDAVYDSLQTFRYLALDCFRIPITGHIEACSVDEACAKLKKTGFFPTNIWLKGTVSRWEIARELRLLHNSL